MEINQVVFIGRLTKDPDVRLSTDDKKSVAKFSIAIDRGKDRNGNDLGADFPSIVCFGKLAETCYKYLVKGMLVAVTGRWHTDKYENKEGKMVYTNECYASGIKFLEWRNAEDTAKEKQNRADADAINSAGGATDSIPEGFTKLIDDDIPF